MNFNQFCANFIFNDKKNLTLITAPIEFLNIVFMMLFIASLFQTKRNIKSEIKYIIMTGLIFCINRILFKEIISYLLFISEIMIIYKLLNGDNILNFMSKLLISIFCSEILQAIFCSLFYKSNDLCEIAKQVLSLFIFVNVYLISKNFNITINRIKIINKKEILKNLSIAVIIIMVIYIQEVVFKRTDAYKTIEIAILNIIAIVLSLYIMVSNLSKTREIREATAQIDNLEVYNKNLTEVNDSIRGFKHDFNNIVQAMNGYIMIDDIKSLKKYFKGLMVECDQLKTMDRLSSEMLKNPAIFSLLLNKYKLAQEMDIKVDLDIAFNFSEISECSYDISRILGILLDNAIEACMECEDKIMNISLFEKKNIKYINIENTYDKNKDIDTSKIFEKNFTTKKESGNQGIGLWEVKKILEKNKRLELYTTKEGEFFKQSLEIYENPIG